MSTLNEEIVRLETAKINISNVLTARGVSVPSNATLDTYHNLINSIKGGTSSEEVTATKANVLAGTTTITSDSNDEIVEGTMPNNGAVAPAALGAGGSYTIPAGYHNGSGKVTVQSLATMTASGDATAAHILSGKKAYVDGNLITGNMTDRGAQTPSALNCGGSYTIPAGYHNGSGKVTANSLANQTKVDSGKTAVAAAQMLSGYQGWVNGSKISGSMANQGAQNKTITPSSSTQTYTIPAGYHNGSGKVTVSGYGTKYTMGSKTASHATLNKATAYLLASGVPTNASVIVTGTIKSTATAAATTYYIDGGLPGGEYGEVTIGAKTTDCTSTPNIGKAQMTGIRIYREGTNIYYYNPSGKLYSLSCTVNYFYSA